MADRIQRAMPPIEKRGDDFDLAFGQFAGQVGFYLGEVIRRNHGARWGWAIDEGVRVPGLMTDSGKLLWPLLRAGKRLVNGREDGLLAYVAALVEPDPLVE